MAGRLHGYVTRALGILEKLCDDPGWSWIGSHSGGYPTFPDTDRTNVQLVGPGFLWLKGKMLQGQKVSECPGGGGGGGYIVVSVVTD